MTFVVDASVAVKWYVPEDHSTDAERLLDQSHDLHAPELIVPEFGNILWKKQAKGELTKPKALEIARAFTRIPLTTYPAASLLESALIGAMESGQTVYDWTYLALAIALDCTMVTADKKFHRALESKPVARYLCWIADIP
jgi:predicted nucleic acid-binding protein